MSLIVVVAGPCSTYVCAGGPAPIAISDSEASSISRVWDAELNSDRPREFELAKSLSVAGSDVWTVPWAKGVLYRLGSVGKPIALEFNAVDGRHCDLSRMRGKVVLIHFWATWCPPCVQGMPKLSRAYAQYHANGLEVVGVSWDSDKPVLQKFIEKAKLEWPIYFDGQRPGKWGMAFGVGGVPYILLVGRSGNLQYFGADENEAIDVLLPKLLAEP